MKHAPFRLLVFFLLSIAANSKASAFFSTFDTADILPPDQYSVGLEPQLILGGDYPAGFNAIGHFETHSTDDIGFKFLAGGGKIPFEAGAFIKYVPFPDLPSQPGIGAFAGILYTRDNNGISNLHLRFHPVISKKFDSVNGEFTPYLSIPLGISFETSSTSYPVTLSPGLRYRLPGYKNMAFLAELGISANSSASYISIGLIVPFDKSGIFYFD